MVEVDSSTAYADGVAFVTVTVRNPQTTAQRVCLRISVPTWAPQRGGLSAPAWNGDTWEAVVGPGRCRGLGFASPVEKSECLGNPVEVVSVDRARDVEAATAQPEAILADLDAWSPTTDIVTRNR
ncbi:hypothetical protein OB919_06540 [Halobacteria archaeon AArc-curdl1]|uniref:Uncharacterized protein n=1 Tax=Natronosalvus hydrolyticus TaxID=2979988 RepID=A0AAP2Z7D6_9EURY|nr:hypothetical protein [Halobacteria archaeon AArc-curdl1]